jgi:maleate isomerase
MTTKTNTKKRWKLKKAISKTLWNRFSCVSPMWLPTGHSIHSFRGDGDTALREEKRLETLCGIPFVTPSRAVLAGLEAIGRPKKISILTPYWPPADQMIAEFFRACGYDVVSTHGLKSTGPTAVARFTQGEIMKGFEEVNRSSSEALIHVGTDLPVSHMTQEVESRFAKPMIGVNVATYWLALRRIGIKDLFAWHGSIG